MAILFISDLHLSATSLEMNNAFIQLLEKAKRTTDRLYILGDLFDRWIGDDDNSAYLSPLIKALQAYTEIKPAFLLVGNRDFLLGKEFCLKAGLTLLPDPALIHLYQNEVVLCTHGDLLCINDLSYQKYRNKVRNPLYQKYFLTLPLWARKLFAKAMRWISQAKQKNSDHFIFDADQSTLLDWMQKAKVNKVIHGHTHQSGIHLVYQDKTILQWFVLGDWHPGTAYVLWCYPDGTQKLISAL